MNDTIVAISTALGVGAISIIRVSGEESIKIVGSLFSNKNFSSAESHTIHYGYIQSKGEIIDEVLVSLLRSPKTFTTEDTVEINCHGGIATTKKILELLLINGCRLAEPGEFTKRAFLNGRIDLIEAEGVMDLINAKTERARNLAINEVDGKVSDLIKQLRQQIIEILANIEVNIDYPEYEDIEEMTNTLLLPKINAIKEKLNKILSESNDGKIIKDGIDTVIIGRPNVGKSSLLNKLINEEKAIVTEIAGTTRDIVEGKVSIDGILLNIIDTAGIRETNDVVEKIGVKKSVELINKGDLILYVMNNNDQIEDEDYKILEMIKEKPHIVVVNKIDLERKLDVSKITDPVMISVTDNKGIEELKNKIKNLFDIDKFNNSDFTYITNARSLAIIKQACETLNEIETGIELNMPIDMIEIDIKKIWSDLGLIIGETYQDELIDQLFKQFCLGK